MKNSFIFLVAYFLFIPVFAQPVIHSFTPGSGPVGTIITIKGTGFHKTPAGNLVYFGVVRATISAATDTTLRVTVPAGTTFQPVSVTTNNLTAYSRHFFSVTFIGSNGPFSATSFLPKTDLTAGIYPHSVALADFNGDGRIDLLVPKGSSNTVSVFSNTSSGNRLSFAAKQDFAATGNNHEGSAIADLDGDGKQDFVITNSTSLHSISVYKNISTAETISFAPKMDFPTDNAPYSVAIGDLNGDGKPDLAVGNTGSNKVSIYRNTSTSGSISFDAKIDYIVGTNPYGVAISDLDDDGKADLAVTCQGSRSGLYIMRNTSTGGFSFDEPVSCVTEPGFFTVSTGDLDGDDKPEVAAANAFSNAVIVLKNKSTPGNISFYSPQNFTSGNYPVCVSIADLNGDGKPDLVSSNRTSNDVSVLKNASAVGNLSFSAPVHYGVGTDPFYVAAGDLNGDSQPEVIAANSSDATISILTNLIGANVAPSINSFTPTSGINGTRIQITGSNFTGTTSVKFGNVAASSFTIDSPSGITAIVGPGASGNVSVTTNYGTATLAGFRFNGPLIQSFTPTVAVSGTIVTIAGDNFIGVTEVKFGGTAAVFTVMSPTTITATVGTGSTGDVTVTTTNGTARLAGFNYGVPTISSFSPTSGKVGSTVTINGTNFNPQAADNIVFFGAVKAKVSTASATQLRVIVPPGATYLPISVTTNHLTAYASQPFILTFPNDSPALTTSSFSVAANYGVGTYPVAVAIADLNEDGKADLVTANSVSNSISVLKNNSSNEKFAFSTKLDLSTSTTPKKIAIGDLDGDGKPDMVVTNFNAGNASTISVFRNTSTSGTISFASKLNYNTGEGSIGIAIADMNMDGKPDIIVSSGNSGIFSIFKNTTISPGTITLASKQDFTLLTHPDNLTIADLDKDGKPDLITSNFSDESISIFRNISTGGNISLQARIDYTTDLSPTHVITGDLDGDNRMDVIVSNYSSGTISFFKNYSSSGFISLGARQDYSLATSNISLADLNGDGKLDLCTGRRLTGLISILENTFPGSNNFSFANNIDFTTGIYDTNVATGDLDGDGKPELVAANTIENNISILKNNFAQPEITAVSSSSGEHGTTITLTGNHLGGATSVKFGGIAAESFTVVSSTKIEVVVGGGSSGTITVTTPLGVASFESFSFIPTITPSGLIIFCKGESVTLTSSAQANNQWYHDRIPIEGAVSNTLIVNKAGNYTVKTTNNGITTTSSDIDVKIIAVPTPIISIDENNNMVSSASAGNQWYWNENLIPGANNQTYRPVQNGSYTVKSTVDGCTSNFSDAQSFIITGIKDLSFNQSFKVFPNPFKDKIFLTWNIDGVSSLNIEIIDLQGRKLVIRKNLPLGIATDLSLLSPGMYIIKVYNKSKVAHTLKIVKN